MNLPLISIIIPVYNVEQFLKDCIESVIHQSYENLEIILVDDGSPDNCPRICDEYLKLDKRIIVLHQKNQGLSGARNSGIEIATGEYLTFVDSDDVLHFDYISALYKALDNHKFNVSICNNISFNTEIPTSKFTDYTYSQIQLTDIFKIQNGMCAWGKLFHKSLFSKNIFPLNKIHEDEFIIFKLLYEAKTISYCNSGLYYYRDRAGSIMKDKKIKFYLDFLEALLENYNYFYKYNERKICEIFLLRLTYLNSDYNIFCKKNNLSNQERIKISHIILKLPKRKISLAVLIKVYIKSLIIFIH